MHPNDAEGIANSVDPDQQSDLGLQCLPRPVCPKTLERYVGYVSFFFFIFFPVKQINNLHNKRPHFPLRTTLQNIELTSQKLAAYIHVSEFSNTQPVANLLI